jgi:hypothetical protein
MKSMKRLTTLALLLFAGTSICKGDLTLALNKSFVNKVKNKATITTNLTVDAHPKDPHSIKDDGNDGDIHMAGRDSIIQLPLVAEILNARREPTALQLLKTLTSAPVSITGAWRIWFEHLGTTDQIQGTPAPNPAPKGSNPDHLFEIHPITTLGGVDVLDSFVEITGFQAYPASTAFPFYDDQDATIQASQTAIMIASGQSKYNYAEFVMELAGKPKDVGDGFIVLANVYNSGGSLENPASPNVHRMIFVKGTAPATKLLTLSKGDTIHVLGIPRVNLSDVSLIASQNGTNQVPVKLPYEMIIAALLP